MSWPPEDDPAFLERRDKAIIAALAMDPGPPLQEGERRTFAFVYDDATGIASITWKTERMN